MSARPALPTAVDGRNGPVSDRVIDDTATPVLSDVDIILKLVPEAMDYAQDRES